MAETTILYHGTTARRWRMIRREGVLRRAPFGDTCVSLTDDYRVARHFADNSCSAEIADGDDPKAKPVVLRVDASGLRTEAFSSATWGEGVCDWERETACWEDVPLHRVAAVPPAKAVRYDRDVYRIQRGGDDVLAFAMRLSNGRWALCDTDDRRLDGRTYDGPKEIAAAFDALPPDKSMQKSMGVTNTSTETKEG
jgi:hypothetical protein